MSMAKAVKDVLGDGYSVAKDGRSTKIIASDGTELPAGEVAQIKARASEIEAAQRWADAHLTKGDFCLALYGAGILSADDAERASSGDWPDAFSGAVAGLSEAERLAARIKWRTVSRVYRMDPLLLAVQAHMNADPTLPDMTDAQLDAIFGLD